MTNPDDCNLGCAMCPCGRTGRAGSPRRMPPALALAVLAERRGSALREVIPSTMGEPLLWDGLDALLARCADLGLLLNVTTNGTWPRHGPDGWARRLVPAASDVKVSWNGATPATASAVMAGIDLDRAVEGVRRFVAVRDAAAASGARHATLSFQVTVQAANVDEVPAIVALAGRLRVDRVKLNHVQPRPGLAVTVEGSLLRDAEGLRRWNAAVEGAQRAAAAASSAGWPLRLENAVPLGADPVARGRCPFLGREAWIHPDGRFAPCPHPQAEALGAFGTVLQQPLGEIWDGRELAELREGFPGHRLCRECAFRGPGGA